MNDLKILAEEVMPGDYVFFGKIPVQVLATEVDETMIYIQLNNGKSITCAPTDTVTILDDSVVEDEMFHSNKHRGEF